FASKARLRWTPRGEPADVYLNGEYAGLYLLAERIEAAPDKMNLSDKDFLGQLKSKTMIGKNDAAFLIDGGSYFEIKFPVNPSERRLSEIEKSVKDASRALLNNSDNLFDILNIDSFARMFLIDEIFMDMDADINSSYYYSDGGKICAGPAWDYDRSMANMNSDVTNLKIKYPNQIYCAEPYNMPYSGDISCLRYSRLYRNKRFRQRLAEIYKNEYRALLVNTVKDISVLGETVSASDAMESVRYKAMRQRFDAEYYKDTREEISDIKSLLEAHLAFLDSVFIDGKEYKSVWFSAPDFRIRPPKRYSVAELYIVDHRAVEVGSKVENVLGKKMYISGTDTVFDFNTPITDNITLLTKSQSELEADIRRYKETK
ncbi:MAG: CotH kinase family protein, partial [Abditibacteriota bacterium]|nr:CotH kinase family protein [Abditibacteriota bacterium]